MYELPHIFSINIFTKAVSFFIIKRLFVEVFLFNGGGKRVNSFKSRN